MDISGVFGRCIFSGRMKGKFDRRIGCWESGVGAYFSEFPFFHICPFFCMCSRGKV
uniref:Uncharacterized protein n=1 Tax=Arundo donax TaxID=35708 RepID=A0A0A9PXS1_ARUDO